MENLTGERSVGEVATQFLTKMAAEQKPINQQEINRFVRWYGPGQPFRQITSHDVEVYAERFGASLSGADKLLGPLKDFFVYAKKEKIHTHNLGTSIKVRRTAKRESSHGRRERRGEEPVHMTEEGYAKLEAELESLKAERLNIAQMLRHAMADKDFRENAPLDAARDHQGMVEAKIRELESTFRRAKIMDAHEEAPNGAGDTESRAAVGSTVVIRDLETDEEMQYTLVYPNEANLARGRLSVASPTGKALLDRARLDVVEVATPVGMLRYRIDAIEAQR